jgi:PadR family transcriptional regulator, regulatory protein AphA
MSLTTTEAALLGLLLKGPMSGYDVLKDAERSVGYFWAPAKTQVYATLPKLVRAGFATEEKVVQETRPDKRVYALTEKGRQALREWLDDEAPASRDLILLKLFFGAEADPEALRRQLAERRQHAERLRATLEELDAEPGARDDPFQTLTRRYGLLYSAAVQQWAEEAERELERLAPANRAAR